MNAGKMRVPKRGHTVEPGTRHITFWTFGPASEYVSVKANQSFPIPGNKIYMNVLRSDWHFLLDKHYKYHNLSADVILSGVKNL
jgi:hypothetical protein